MVFEIPGESSVDCSKSSAYGSGNARDFGMPWTSRLPPAFEAVRTDERVYLPSPAKLIVFFSRHYLLYTQQKRR